MSYLIFVNNQLHTVNNHVITGQYLCWRWQWILNSCVSWTFGHRYPYAFKHNFIQFSPLLFASVASILIISLMCFFHFSAIFSLHIVLGYVRIFLMNMYYFEDNSPASILSPFFKLLPSNCPLWSAR